MRLFHFCPCFEQPSAHHQENQLYQYIIWYISLRVGGRLVCRSESSSLTYIPSFVYYMSLYIFHEIANFRNAPTQFYRRQETKNLTDFSQTKIEAGCVFTNI